MMSPDDMLPGVKELVLLRYFTVKKSENLLSLNFLLRKMSSSFGVQELVV
jgi:hypothetical protein